MLAGYGTPIVKVFQPFFYPLRAISGLAIEVDWITKEQEGRGQARRYAEALDKEPAVALIIPKESNLTVTNTRLRTFLLQRPDR